MSAEALKEFNDERRKLLEAQRDCAWCGAHFNTLEELINHIWEKHSKNEKGLRE
jgi:hypothetical protein